MKKCKKTLVAKELENEVASFLEHGIQFEEEEESVVSFLLAWGVRQKYWAIFDKRTFFIRSVWKEP